MSSAGPPDRSGRLASTARETGSSLYDQTKQTLLTGVAIAVPLVVTLYVLTIALDFVSGALDPFIALLRWFGIVEEFKRVRIVSLLVDVGVYPYVVDFFTELIALVVLGITVAVLGTIGRHRYGERVIDVVDLLITSIPGVGTVYRSFRRMGDVMIDERGENFRDIKLVQCFGEDVYVLGFVTSDSPPTVEETAGHDEMVSMFLPLAPNPVTGGFLTYVPESDVYDIEMTVEEGIRSILTSGVATGEGARGRSQLTVDDIREMTDFERFGPSSRPGGAGDGSAASGGTADGDEDGGRE
jgi:uncharacterized membrane protein